jgi:hypothetical protein
MLVVRMTCSQTVARYELQVVFWCKEHVILNTSIPSLLVQGTCHSQYEHSFPFAARSMSFSILAFLPFWCKEYVINDYQYEHSFPMAYVKHRL